MISGSLSGLTQKENYSIADFYRFKNEIGINVTNVIGNVLSLNPNNASSLYGLTYRRHSGKWSFRSAFNINYSNLEDEDFGSGSVFTRKLNITETNTRIGFEKHMVLSKRMMFSFGLDALLGINTENSEIIDFNFGGNTFASQQNTIGYGLGPVLRFEYKISDRLFISTESSLYGYTETTKESLTVNGVNSDEPTKKSSNIRLELPQSLFFNVSF